MAKSTDTKELVVVGENNQLATPKIEALLKDFGEPFMKARELSAGYEEIIITDETDTSGMEKARKRRLELKEIRVKAEKIRVLLKEDSLREGRAIDGMANIIKAIIVPAEQHLEKQEKFAETIQAERKAKLKAERIAELGKYVDDVSVYNLELMTEDAYKQILSDAKVAHEAKLKAEEAEAKRIEKQKKIDAEKLAKAEAAAKKLRDQKKKADEKAAEEKERADKAERELKEKQEKEEAEKKAEEKAKHQAAIAPDKDKLGKLAEDILLSANKLHADLLENPTSKLSDPNAIKIAQNAEQLLMKTAKYIKENTQKI